MANSPQLDKYGGFIGFMPLDFLEKKKIRNICEKLKNKHPEFLFLRPFQFPVIFLLWNIKKI